MAELHYELAMAYARAGLAVMPCYPDDDRAPLISGWTTQRIPVERVHAIWNPAPHKYETGHAGTYAGAAIGLVAGLSGLLVVDDDIYKKQPGGEYEGAETFERTAQANHDPLNAVPRVVTPKGGMHYYFRQPDGMALGNSTGSLPKGTDVKGGGGFVFAPGSYTVFGQYSALAIDQILNAPPVPEWLIKILQRPLALDTPLCVFPVGSSSEAITGLQLSLRYLDPDCDHRQWFTILACIWRDTNGSEDGRQLAHEWSSKGSKYYDSTRRIRGLGFANGADLIDVYWKRGFQIKGKYSGEHTLAMMLRKSLGW
ncbi:bifunctional DNA primase/polymerase [Mesorhizobium sp. LHD-90]|uniref:bifunctional DNA primase/polymerase n=1 Tax=Mesorhizobium sp. LHD-90 TaxID=3071414 RepID=UPI0027E1112A|nr:bifunctional DNA primase/polymerase [Mesorhizobium sp. LHD-90]MDQ6433768.1 bifunctional DNA primase/polymerase [Mesorhizobium sp. LHD-90]